MRERTAFGERLFKARTHAKLSQPELAEAAKVSQGNIGELEWKGEGSMAVVRLAMACGVRPQWLAEGDGDMLDEAAWPFSVITRDDVLALNETQLGIVEGAMLNALERIHAPNADRETLKKAGLNHQARKQPVRQRSKGKSA